jgi:hypothetical protein
MKPNDFLPAGASADAAQDWSLLPIPDDLNLRQKEQIARMIGPVRKTTPKLKGENHGPSKKTH